jgi:DNA polymerase-1
MTIVNSDAKALEVNCAAYLSQDPVLLEEVRSGFDMHSSNQQVLGLPTRLIAKTFVFRLIYGGSAYAYSVDADFASCGFSQKKWQEIIDKFYEKYKGLYAWHIKIVQEAIQHGQLVMPTGRVYKYEPSTNYKGERVWPRTTILNYPVQGLGADIMTIVRVDFFNRLKNLNLEAKIINTVHDSIVVDCPKKEVDTITNLFYNIYMDVPKNFQKLFGVEYNLPLTNEISVGPNLKDLTEI